MTNALRNLRVSNDLENFSSVIMHYNEYSIIERCVMQLYYSVLKLVMQRFVPFFLILPSPREFWPLSEAKYPIKKPWGGTWGSHSSVCLYLILLFVLSSIILVAYNKKKTTNNKLQMLHMRLKFQLFKSDEISVYYESLCLFSSIVCE